MHTGPFIGYHNNPQPLTDSVTGLIYLSDVYMTAELALPTSVLRSFKWFLERLTKSRASGVTMRPDARLTVISTRTTQCM
jgi:hypothetical protein